MSIVHKAYNWRTNSYTKVRVTASPQQWFKWKLLNLNVYTHGQIPLLALTRGASLCNGLAWMQGCVAAPGPDRWALIPKQGTCTILSKAQRTVWKKRWKERKNWMTGGRAAKRYLMGMTKPLKPWSLSSWACKTARQQSIMGWEGAHAVLSVSVELFIGCGWIGVGSHCLWLCTYWPPPYQVLAVIIQIVLVKISKS